MFLLFFNSFLLLTIFIKFHQHKPLKGFPQHSPYIVPSPTTKDLTAYTPSQSTSFTKQNSSKIHPSTHPLQSRPTDDVSSQGKSPKATTGLMQHLPCTQPHVLFTNFLHKAKPTSPCNPCLLLLGLPSWHTESYELRYPKYLFLPSSEFLV